MSRSIEIALLGCGRVAGHHCLAISQTPGVSLSAVCDLRAQIAKEFSDMYGVPAYQNYHEMLRKTPSVDVVVVATPSGMHFEHAIDILAKYKKNVLVEKPTFLGIQNAQSAFKTAKKLGLEIFPVFQNRYNKAVERVKKSIVNNELGKIRIVSVRVRWCRPQRYYDLSPWRGTYSHDGGALTNQGIHHVDLLTYLGGRVVKVNSIMRTLGSQIEVEDTVIGSLEYNYGGVGVLECTTAARPDDFEASISIVGEKGLAQIGGVAVNELQLFTPDPSQCQINSEDFIGIDGKGAVYGNGHFQIYKDLVSSLRGGKEYPITEDDCVNTLALLDAFYRSDEAKRWVDIDFTQFSKRLGRRDEKISGLFRAPK